VGVIAGQVKFQAYLSKPENILGCIYLKQCSSGARRIAPVRRSNCRHPLEYDTERCGAFEPLRFIPAGKTAVLGLVTTKDGTLESREYLLRRIDEASQVISLDNLSLSPQCGFASVSIGNLLSEDDQRRKLELVVETARRVWG